MYSAGAQSPVRCRCGRVVATGFTRYVEYLVCPACGANCSLAPPLAWRLRFGLYNLKRNHLRGRGNQLSLFDCFRVPWERARFHADLKEKERRERVGIKRTGVTRDERDATGGLVREFGCSCDICTAAAQIAERPS